MLAPVSPIEEVFWNWLPAVLNIVSVVGALGAVVFFLLAYRRSKRNGFLFLAIAAALPLVLSRIGTLSPSEHRSHAMPADAQLSHATPSVYIRHIAIDVPLISVIACCGAILLYRDERKRA